MTRVCAECGAEVGSKHHRALSFLWKREARDIIENKKKEQDKMKEMVMKGQLKVK